MSEEFAHSETHAGASTAAGVVEDLSTLGVVAIGRNEGDRLKRCLRSLVSQVDRVVYVDSNSTDDSVEFAESIGVEVITLDLSVPFTAARARNAGYERLLEESPDLEFVMFLDGDCEVVDSWFHTGVHHLREKPKLGVVYGRRDERYPDASVYNRLCDMEWNPEPGEVPACGGDSLFRVAAFEEAGRFDPTFIAGEEPELSVRVRECGWTLEHLDVAMTIHDAAMTRFKQWWRRSERAGHAYAEGAARHGRSEFRHNVRPVRRIIFWGLLVPPTTLTAAAGAALWPPLAFVAVGCLLAYGLLGYRVFRWRRSRGDAASHAITYAAFTVLGKLPEAKGLLSYRWNRVKGTRRRLIEYK